MLKRVNYFILIPLILSGCAKTMIPAAPLDQDVQRESESFHSFIVGELESKKDNLPGAIKNLHRASELSGTLSPELSSRLAVLELKSGNLEKALEQSKKAVSVAPTDAEILSLHAGILEALNRSREAREFYARAAAADDEAIEPLMMQAVLLAKEGKNAEAQDLIDVAIKKNPTAVSLYIFSARAYEENGQKALAISRARKGYEVSKEAPEVGLELVRILLKQEKLHEAKVLCEDILKKAPDNSLARRVLAQLLLNEQKPDEALVQLEIVEKTDSDPTQAQIGIALLELQRKNFASALQKLNIILVKKPNDGSVLYALAHAYNGIGNLPKAIDTIKRIPTDAPEYEPARMFAALLLRQNGKLPEAIEIIEELRDDVPFNPQLELYAASLYREKGDNKKVRKILEDLFDKQEPNDRLLFDYAVVLHDLDDRDGVVEALEKALTLNSSNIEVLNFLAYELAENGSATPADLLRAQTLAKKAVTLRPRDGFVLDTSAWIAFKRNDLETAKAQIEKAMKLTPNDPVILEHAAQIFTAGNNPERVKSLCKQAISIAPKDREAEHAIERCRQRN